MKIHVIRFAVTLIAATMSLESNAQSFFKPIYIDCNVGIVGRTADELSGKENLRKQGDNDIYCCFDFGGDAHVRHTYIEVKPEFMINRVFSVDAGVRFTHSFGETTSTNNLMWKVKEEGVNTYYVTTDRLTQHAYYLGIPIGIRAAFADLDRVSPFIKAGVAVNFKVGSHNNARFNDSRFNEYEEQIKQYMGRPKAVALPIYISGGIQCGPSGMINVELMCPYFMKYSNTFSMCKLKESGFGLSLGVRIPRIDCIQ